MFTAGEGAFPGRIPSTGLILAPDGKLRGMTERGGPGNRGTVYAIDPATDTWSLVTGLGGVGAPGLGAPATALTADSQGLLWGGADIADQGGHGTLGYGGLYTLDPRTGEVTRRLVFTGRTGSAKGTALDGGLTMDNQGRLWGFSRQGGGADFGTVFRVDPASGVLTTVRDFTGASDGRYPGGAPFLDGQGNIWGVTRGDYGGGEASLGTVFKIHTDTGAFTTVTTFTGATGAAVGLTPNPGLASDGLSSIWGTTFYGGTEVRGSLFKLDAGSGAFTNVWELGIPAGSRPVLPITGLAKDGLGFLWGVTNATSSTKGAIYKINAAATGAFTGISEPPGSVAGNLVHDGAGWMWGTAGGEIIYKTARDTHRTVILHQLTRLGGAAPGEWLPSAPLLKHTDGHFYGVAQRGGVLADGSPAGRGQIFRLHLGPLPHTLPPASVSATTARIPGTVHSNDSASEVFLDYSTDPALTGSLALPVTSPAVLDGEQPVTAFLRGLEPATTYHYRLRAVNPDNTNPQTGEILSFTTSERGLAPWLAAHGFTGAEALPGADPDADGLPTPWNTSSARIPASPPLKSCPG
ncbi:MAG: hypothetical protein JWM59_229 [Verrucomicrobiales bacterium]|nr:hypothetical protein [Verrucomicrobiales bacterium]